MPDEREKEASVTYGTAAHDAPVARDDFERALRSLHLNDADTRDLLLRLAAQVVALTEELGEPGKARVEGAIASALERIRTTDARTRSRVWIDTSLDNKYEVETSSPPCAEVLHLCGARCCTFEFPLSTADLDEGVLRWDYGQPYTIRQRASDGFCVHNDPVSKGCTVHAQRPTPCRRYDCRNDSRVWIDFAARIPAPLDTPAYGTWSLESFDLMKRVKLRAAAEAVESNAVTRVFPDEEPRPGPVVTPRTPRTRR